MWRKVAEDFLGKSPHLAAQAFMVKSAYYKNLWYALRSFLSLPATFLSPCAFPSCNTFHFASPSILLTCRSAYEISTHWKKEPPPIEILERTTAKGANVMGRTLENYQPRGSRDEEALANGHSSDAEEQDKTPKAEKMDIDEPESATGRSTRGLRHAPPQRVLFQPDLNPARQTRTASNQIASPSPGTAAVNGIHNSSYLNNPTSMTLANYEPKPQYPLTLKPVITPANNPDYYRQKRKAQQEAAASHVAKKTKGLMLPGTGFIGPNIYVRAQLALQSGLPEEEQYALHHLVKISHERGDKYRFDQFAGLAEALINKVLQVSNLFYDIDWSISYDEDAIPGKSTYLDGIHGTSDVLKKLRARIPLDTDDEVQTIHFRQALNRITEAGLIIRNMVMLDENAQYISRLPLLRDYFCIVLNLRPHPAVVELQHYALETAEQLTKYYNLGSDDVLYHSLLGQLETNDRGKIVTSLRAVSRIGHAFIENKRLEDVPVAIVERLGDWMMVDDEELRSACLDFLMQYTSIADNVETLVLDTDIQGLVRQLSALLLFHAKEDVPRQKAQPSKEQEPQPTRVPRLARSLVEQLLRYEEPERSSHWCVLYDLSFRHIRLTFSQVTYVLRGRREFRDDTNPSLAILSRNFCSICSHPSSPYRWRLHQERLQHLHRRISTGRRLEQIRYQRHQTAKDTCRFPRPNTCRMSMADKPERRAPGIRNHLRQRRRPGVWRILPQRRQHSRAHLDRTSAHPQEEARDLCTRRLSGSHDFPPTIKSSPQHRL